MVNINRNNKFYLIYVYMFFDKNKYLYIILINHVKMIESFEIFE